MVFTMLSPPHRPTVRSNSSTAESRRTSCALVSAPVSTMSRSRRRATAIARARSWSASRLGFTSRCACS
jgi:hypothetical protein